MADREFLLRIVGDVSNAQKSLNSLDNTAGKFSSGAKKFAAGIAAAFTVDQVVDFGKQIVSAASDTEQALGGSQAIFKEYAKDIEAFSETTAESLGISQEQFLRLSNITGSLLKNAGVPLDETADATKNLTTRAADLAAMFGGDVDQALGAVNSALKGEMDPLEAFGVSLKASAVEAKAQAMGLTDAEGKVTDYGKAMAAVELIMEQSSDAAGTFARESDTLAGRQAILSAKWKDMQADLGQKLLPIITQFAGYILDTVIPAVQKLADWFAVWWPPIYEEYVKPTMEKVQAIIQQVVAIVQEIWDNWGADIMEQVKVVWDYVGSYIENGIRAIQAILDIVLGIISGDWSRVWTGIKNLVGAIWNQIVNQITYTIKTIANVLQAIWQIVSAPFEAAGRKVKEIFDGLVNWFRNVPSRIGSAFTGLVGLITRPFTDAWNAAKQAWSGAETAFRNIKNGIVNVFSGLTNAITAPFRSAFDGIKRLWNSTVGGFGFTVPSWIPGVGGKGFKIPYMAEGGIVTRPTIALIGEAGPEAVVPLNSRNTPMGGVTINVYALTASAEVGRRVLESLNEYQRISGNRIA